LAMLMSKRSPPAMPPAVLTSTAESPASSGEGKRTRSDPASCSSRRRVTPSMSLTSNRTAPLARLAAKIAALCDVVSFCIPPTLSPRDLNSGLLRHRPGSQGHLTADFRRIEIASIAGVFHGAAVHDREIVAELAGKVEILLDEDDGDVAEAAKVGDGAADILDDRGLDAFRRLVEQQQFRPHHQRPPDRQLLLLSAGKIAAAAAEHGLQHRKQRKDVVGDVAVLARQRPEAGLEVFLDRQQWKNLAPLRHEADAFARPFIGLEASDVGAVEDNRPA